MKNYNDEYYIVLENFNEQTLYLEALQKSADRNPGHVKLDFTLGPLFFENSYKDEDLEEGASKPLKSAHMNMNNVLISNQIRDNIKHFEILGTQLFPSVIIDDLNVYHDEYWYINAFERFDFLDFDLCQIDEFNPKDERHDIEKYCLSSSALDAVPEESRLIFKPKGTFDGYVFFHKKIVDIFLAEGMTNLNFVKVSDYEVGMEF